jgi:GntR family transcriptional regulator
MLVALDSADRTPIYAQVEHGLRAAIASGRLKVGDQLPTVRELAVDLSVNANTIARVYSELERAGVLETRRGVGTFVRASRAEARPAPEHARRLRAFATRVLSDGDAQGFSAGEVIAALRAHRTTSK